METDNKDNRNNKCSEDIIKMYNDAISYLNYSREINLEFGFNKVKNIVILIYITMCYIFLGAKEKAAINIKEALIYLVDLNQNFIENDSKLKLSSNILLIINSVLFEQIFFYIAQINYDRINRKNLRLTCSLLLVTLRTNIFKTDLVHSMIFSLIKEILISHNSIYGELKTEEEKDLSNFMEKLENRFGFDPHKKKVFYLFSIEIINSINENTIEFIELLLKNSQKYLGSQDKVNVKLFDQNDDIEVDSKYFFGSETNFLNVCNMGHSYFQKIFEERNKKMNIRLDKTIMSLQEHFDYNYDNYIFLFINSDEYALSNKQSKRREIRTNLNKQNVSFYIFVFGKKNPKIYERILNDMRYLNEGVVFLVDSFSSFKLGFQNISRITSNKGLFSWDSNNIKKYHIN